MALKDWKKTQMNKLRIVYQNSKTKKTLYITKHINNYSVGSYSGVKHYFKTNTLALAYAKAYMKKH